MRSEKPSRASFSKIEHEVTTKMKTHKRFLDDTVKPITSEAKDREQ